MTISIKMFDNQGLSPAVTMAQRMHLELLDAGMAHTANPLPVWNDPALVAYDDETPVGAMIYRHDAVQGSWFILCAYVIPERRRQGIHSLLFNTLVARARQRGDINAIMSGTHVRNIASQRSQEAQGRRAYAIYYEYRLSEFEAAKDPLEVKAQ